MPMRSELVESYFAEVTKGTNGDLAEVFRIIYRELIDLRIFNNLKQQLNEMIEDEKSLIQIDDFRKLFFTYFKGEVKASLLYEKLLPFITVWGTSADAEEQSSHSNLKKTEAVPMVSI